MEILISGIISALVAVLAFWLTWYFTSISQKKSQKNKDRNEKIEKLIKLYQELNVNGSLLNSENTSPFGDKPSLQTKAIQALRKYLYTIQYDFDDFAGILTRLETNIDCYNQKLAKHRQETISGRGGEATVEDEISEIKKLIPMCYKLINENLSRPTSK